MFGRKMRENAVISSKYDFRHQRLNESPICALEDEVDFVVLKLEEYAFPVYQDLSDVASQLEKRKSQHRRTEPIAAWAAAKSCKFRGVKTFRKIFTFIISFPLIYDIL
jgi:hypothetical protein